MTAIRVQNVTKIYKVLEKESGIQGAVKALFAPNYKYIKAVNDISFQVSEGEIVGYIGTNGAGKSTTIKMLTGILSRTSGEITVFGRDPYEQRIENAKNIGVVFGQRSQLWWDLPLIDSFEFLAQIYKIDPSHYQERLNVICDKLDLNTLLSHPVRNMSLGQRTRSEIAAAFLHQPQMVFLDEPTIGLDIVVKDKIREFIQWHNRQYGTTILLSSHDMDDIETLCSRVIILDNGQILLNNSLKQIKTHFGRYHYLCLEAVNTLDHLQLPSGCVKESFNDQTNMAIRFSKEEISVSDLIQKVLQQVEITDFKLVEPGIESIIKEIYAGEKPYLPAFYANNEIETKSLPESEKVL